ncbi:hypothetical protein PhCBS80983_g00544 [Powellomyces hirtus]|uniref:Amino acid permease/ SLC12A domain-containing protein n=1 Tax=Powellomyces hirtus TaxID=109895 RepID=A0A507EEV0_9FUNG|nr:hypothetical protein PhCBS80983_g00544 [Powellomyces hirtus]
MDVKHHEGHEAHDTKQSQTTLDGTIIDDYEQGHAPAKADLQRHLKARHVAMISIGGVIGTGLFLGTGGALKSGGPLGLLMGYAIMGTICYSVMCSLGEMVSLLPVPGGHIKLAARFVDPALSFSMGWNYWYNWVIVLPAELSAAAVLINYWTKDVNNGVWITMCLVFVAIINMFGAKAYGEAEFWFASIKVITIVGLIIVGIIIAAGGGPNGKATGFDYWKDPGAFAPSYDGMTGSSAQFFGFWAVLVQAAFSYIGTEIVAIAAGEAKNPRRNIPKAIKRVSFRIMLFYIGGTFIVGLLVKSTDPRLGTTKDANASPFVLGIKDAGINVLPDIINFCLLTSAWSAASSDMYTSSRALYGLAVSGQAPAIFKRTLKNGLPHYTILVSLAFSCLAFMALGSGPGKVFGWFANMTAICGLITWVGICFTYIRFSAGIKAQNISRANFPYTSPLGVAGAWYALIMISIIIMTNAWTVFRYDAKGEEFDTATFITSYLPVPMFLILLFGARFYKKSKMVSPMDMDFVSGVREFEEAEQTIPKPKTTAMKIWNWVM